MLFITILLCFLLICLFFYLLPTILDYIHQLKHTMKLDGPPSTGLLIGNCGRFLGTPESLFKVMDELGHKYFPVYSLRLAWLNSANILTPEDFEVITCGSKHANKSDLYKILHNWLGTGLLTSNGTKWQMRRKILTPAFHFSILREFVNIFNDETTTLVNSIKQKCDQPYVNVTSEMTEFTLKSIAETAMGTKLTYKTQLERDYRTAIHNLAPIYIYRTIHIWLTNNFLNIFSRSRWTELRLLRTLHNFTSKVIKEKEAKFQNFEIPQSINDDNDDIVYTSSKRRLAMLDLLLSAKINDKLIDDGGIREEVDTFMFEGHDTTSLALSYCLMLLANNKPCQAKILEEMAEVLGDIHKKPTYNDMQNLKYMDRCIKESLRLYPSVFFISRQLTDDIILPSTGKKLVKNTVTHLYIYEIHHNPRYYPDPERFDPDRFLPENIQKRHPFAYVPFSAGPRNCIGQRFAILELKAALCGLMANFELEPIDTPESVVLIADFVLRSKDPVKVKFVPRK